MPFNIPYCTITSYSSVEYGNDTVAAGNIPNPVKIVISSIKEASPPIPTVVYPV